jgi:type VI secretion system protein ImpK
MTDGFAQLISPIVRSIVDFQRRPRGEEPALEEVRSQALALFAEAEQKAAGARDLAGEFPLAKAALVYWVDEILINSTWRHASEWREHILEWDYYRERLGGEKFYEKAAEAERLAGTDALETYYLCVALGFRGRYGYSPADLQAWAGRVFARIAPGIAPPERFLPDDPDDARAALQPLPGKSLLLTVSVLTSATVLVTLAGFILASHLAP